MATEKSMLEHINELVAPGCGTSRNSSTSAGTCRASAAPAPEFDQPADDVAERPVSEVEDYLQ